MNSGSSPWIILHSAAHGSSRISIFVFQELIVDLMERLQIFFRFQRFTDLLFETFQTVFVNVFCSWHLRGSIG